MIKKYVSYMLVAAAGTLSAGQIQVGGVSGLTTSYLNAPTTSSCTGATDAYTLSQGASANGCSTATGFVAAGNFQTGLFSNAAPTPTVGSFGSTFSKSANNYFLTNTSVAGSSIVIPVGVYGVDKIWTMLNDYWGADGYVNTTVSFLFSNKQSGTGLGATTSSESIALTNGQHIRSAVDSTGSVAVTCTVTYTAGNSCPQNGLGVTIATTLAAGPVTIGNASVSTGNVFTAAYTSANGLAGQHQYGGGSNGPATTGNVNLDYQLFDFGSLHTADYLVSITIQGQLDGSHNQPLAGSAGSNESRTAISAVTVNQVVPEPSTIFLAFAGLGALGYYRRRKA